MKKNEQSQVNEREGQRWNVKLKSPIGFRYLSFPRVERYEINEIIVTRNNGMAESINQIESLTQTINKIIDRFEPFTFGRLRFESFIRNRVFAATYRTPRARDTPMCK